MLKSENTSNKCYLQVPGVDSKADDQGYPAKDMDHDKYTAAIELSNKCREFYKSRQEAANLMKSRWRNSLTDNESSSSSSSSSPTSSSSSISSQDNEKCNNFKRQKTGIDAAMEKLREEMVSLIDQDLSLMKQLLTLNETIEELKWQRQYYSCTTSCASLSNSRNLDSNWSVSDTEMYEVEDDLIAVNQMTSSLPNAGITTDSHWPSNRRAKQALKDLGNISKDLDPGTSEVSVDTSCQNDRVPKYSSDVTICSESLDSLDQLKYSKHDNLKHSTTTQSLIHHDREQNSFDSGIHDDLVWNV